MTKDDVCTLQQENDELRAKLADAERCAAQALTDRDLLRNQYYQWERQAKENANAPDKVLHLQKQCQSLHAQVRQLEAQLINSQKKAKAAEARATKYRKQINLHKAEIALAEAKAKVIALKRK